MSCFAFHQLFLSPWNVSVCSSSTQSLIELSLCLSSFNLDKLSLSVFELSCVDFLFIFFFLLKWVPIVYGNLWVTGPLIGNSECMLRFHSTLPYLFFSTPSFVASDLPYCCGLFFKKFWGWDLLKVGGHTLCSILVLSFSLCYLSISLLLFCSRCKDILDSLLCCICNANRRIIMCFEARLNQVVLIFCSAFPQLFLYT